MNKTKQPSKTGRPLKLQYEGFKQITDAYLAEMEETNGLPTLVGLSLRLGISNDTLSATYGKMPRFSDELKRVKEIATQKIINKLHNTDKPLINHIFLAKAIAGLRDNTNLDITSDGKPLGVVVLPKRGR